MSAERMDALWEAVAKLGFWPHAAGTYGTHKYGDAASDCPVCQAISAAVTEAKEWEEWRRISGKRNALTLLQRRVQTAEAERDEAIVAKSRMVEPVWRDKARREQARAEAAERLAAEWLNDAKGVPMDEALREIREEIRTTLAGEEIQDVVEMTAQAWNEHYRQALERIQALNDPTHAAQIATLALAGVGPNVQGLPPRGEG